jgi:hypothetical protein
MKKGLWITNGSSAERLLAKARMMKATSVCVRTDNHWLPAAIPLFHDAGIEVYAWRWPAVKDEGFHDKHYFADHQAEYVAAELMPAGLDGYILDPEGSAKPHQDWNSEDVDVAALAKRFFEAIVKQRDADTGSRLNKGRFLLGLTSGNRFPTQQPRVPWAEMVAYCDTLFPQTYWWSDDHGGKIEVHGGTPEKTVASAMKAWPKIQDGRRIVPLGGPLTLSSIEELVAFGDVAADNGWDEVHYYVDNTHVPDAKYEALALV